jgi:hypothetical protein
MLTVKECREILEQDAEGLTDEEVIQIRDWLSMMADIAIESVDKSRAKKENKKMTKKRAIIYTRVSTDEQKTMVTVRLIKKINCIAIAKTTI